MLHYFKHIFSASLFWKTNSAFKFLCEFNIDKKLTQNISSYTKDKKLYFNVACQTTQTPEVS